MAIFSTILKALPIIANTPLAAKILPDSVERAFRTQQPAVSPTSMPNIDDYIVGGGYGGGMRQSQGFVQTLPAILRGVGKVVARNKDVIIGAGAGVAVNEGIDILQSRSSGATAMQGTCHPPGMRPVYNASGQHIGYVRRRRRRRRLLTQSDLQDLAQLKAIIGGGAEFKAAASIAMNRR